MDEQDDGIPDWVNFALALNAVCSMISMLVLLALVSGWASIGVELR